MAQLRQASCRFLATVLFTDIVGSTERAAQLGDRAWGDLLERHHAVVRRELKRFGGGEMGTAGDGFVARFAAPEGAVRCAEAVVEAVGLLGLQVRAGVHFGECEVIDREAGGMVVNIGARVAALAGPGEVLVSGKSTSANAPPAPPLKKIPSCRRRAGDGVVGASAYRNASSQDARETGSVPQLGMPAKRGVLSWP